MKVLRQGGFIETVSERCRMCYTCIRECPAKAIRVTEGRAMIIPSRCIGCGNCIRVCSQQAKQSVSTLDLLRRTLAGTQAVAAIMAPSFPAEFDDIAPDILVGMLRKLGFSLVCEVGFGADLVARKYYELVHQQHGRYIATTCPAVVTYVERYMPEIVKYLAPIVSPMVAMARAIRQIYDPDLKVVFIGPCIAKKIEASVPYRHQEIDVVITFSELRHFFMSMGISSLQVDPSDFDPPYAGYGALFPLTKGMFYAAGLEEDLLTNKTISAEGREDFVAALREFASGTMENNLLEILACKGCIMGAGMTTKAPLFRRRSYVSNYVSHTLDKRNPRYVEEWIRRLKNLDLSTQFFADDQRLASPPEPKLQEILVSLGKYRPEDELNCGACGYDTCREHAIAIYKGLAEDKMCLPYTIEKLKSTVEALKAAHEKLISTQTALMQSEKLASMGQLAAGIAHEVNNPLGVILMYSHLLAETVQDLQLKEDLKTIIEQADRCKKIVSGLLHFARQNKVIRQYVIVPELIKKAIQSSIIPETIQVYTQHEGIEDAEVDPDQILQVLVNLIENACDAMPKGGKLTIETKGDEWNLIIRVTDTGIGIPPEIRPKIFEPFFTTKPIGEGTGLGLAISYGIIKMHRGQIDVESNHNPEVGPTGTTFQITLPRKGDETYYG